MKYIDYHNHPINKLIHFLCIPLIVLTSANFLTKSNLTLFGIGIYRIVLIALLSYYFFVYSSLNFILMLTYYSFIDYFCEKWIIRKNWFMESLIVFILSWVLQFIGHYIEGNRPALMDSITTAVTEAPLFSIMYLFETLGYIVNHITN